VSGDAVASAADRRRQRQLSVDPSVILSSRPSYNRFDTELRPQKQLPRMLWLGTDNTLLGWDKIDIKKLLAIEYRIFRSPEIIQ